MLFVSLCGKKGTKANLHPWDSLWLEEPIVGVEPTQLPLTSFFL